MMRKNILMLMVSATVLTATPAFSTKDNEQSSWSWADLASGTLSHTKLFFTTLFDPFIGDDAQTFVNNQITALTEDSVEDYVYDKTAKVLTTIKNNPYASLQTTLTLTPVGQYIPLLNFGVNAVANIKQTKMFYDLASTLNSNNLLNKTLRMALYTGGIYALTQIPMAAAHEFNTYTQAKNHYTPGECSRESRQWIMPIKTCIEKGGSFAECKTQNPYTGNGNTQVDIFTRHLSNTEDFDPVSKVLFGDNYEGGKTCFFTSLNTESKVTKLCFKNLNNPSDRSIEVVNINLSNAHEGLNSGETGIHVAAISSYNECGYFPPHEKNPTTLEGNPICVLTAIKPGGEVTQICFDPTNPGAVTLKVNEDFGLNFEDNGDNKPVSLIIKNPKKVGLNIEPVQKITSGNEVTKTDDIICENGKCYKKVIVECPNKLLTKNTNKDEL